MKTKKGQRREAMRAAVDEVEPCLKDAPTEGETEAVKAWLFTQQNSVAVRIGRALNNAEVRETMTEALGRTWQRVIKPGGAPQRLWTGLRKCVDHVLKTPGVYYMPGAEKCAQDCMESLEAAIILPQDLIGRGPASGIPRRTKLWEWMKERSRVQDPRLVRPPVLGDFGAVNVLNRLYWLTSDVDVMCSAHVGGRDLPPPPDPVDVDMVRKEIYDTSDAKVIASAWVLAQVHLASVDTQEPTWSILPIDMPPKFEVARDPRWPVMPESRWKQIDSVQSSRPELVLCHN